MKNIPSFQIPEGFIVFISGVPGVGKTTISYELLKRFDEFRIIQETDLMREILRGYNEYVRDERLDEDYSVLQNIEIYDNRKFLDYKEAFLQCKHMKNSIMKIIERQQRKGISSIINGVHIIPEALIELSFNRNVIFINLFIADKEEFYQRFTDRDSGKYTHQNIEYIYNANKILHEKTLRIRTGYRYTYNSLNITSQSIGETLDAITDCILSKISVIY